MIQLYKYFTNKYDVNFELNWIINLCSKCRMTLGEIDIKIGPLVSNDISSIEYELAFMCIQSGFF